MTSQRNIHHFKARPPFGPDRNPLGIPDYRRSHPGGLPGGPGRGISIALDDPASAQLSIDFRTGRPTAIHSGNSCAQQRAACTALNRERARSILEAAKFAPSGESLQANVWDAAFARRTKQWDVPLIPVERLGIRHDEDGLSSSDFLVALTPGAEASPFLDQEWKAVYKLFDLRTNGALGKKIELLADAEGNYEVELCDAVLTDTLEKLSILNDAGALPTEIVGLSQSGDYLIVKQPLAYPRGDFETDRQAAVTAIKGISPAFTGLRRTVAVFWVDHRAWLISDLHERNIMRDADGAPTIIDALIGPVPPPALKQLTWLQHAVEDAQALREGRELPKRKRFEDVDDDVL